MLASDGRCDRRGSCKSLTPASGRFTYVRSHRVAQVACKNSRVRASRVIYVENDPALLGIMTTSLALYAEIEILGSYSAASDALDRAVVERADVALLDLDLGPTNLNGIELGIAMRNINDNIGLVIYSQYPMVDLARRVPKAMQRGLNGNLRQPWIGIARWCKG